MKNIHIILVGILVAILALATFTYTYTNNRDTVTNTDSAPSEISATITIQDDSKTVSIPEGATVLAALEYLNERDKTLALEIKEYPGLGTLVQGMKGAANGTGGKYWQYFVNNEMPQIGADSYIIKDGDTIEWRFEISEF